MHGCVLLASKHAGGRAESSLSLLFSPRYHHDNLLTPAQLHAANISLPSPGACSSSAPHPPILAPLIRLYFILPAFIGGLQRLQLHLQLPLPILSPSYLDLKGFLLPGCHLCRNAFICRVSSVLCPLLITAQEDQNETSALACVNSLTLPRLLLLSASSWNLTVRSHASIQELATPQTLAWGVFGGGRRVPATL